MEEELKSLKPISRWVAFLCLMATLAYISYFLKQWIHIPFWLDFILFTLIAFKTNFVMSFFGLSIGLCTLTTLLEQILFPSLSISSVAIGACILTSMYLLYGFLKMNHVKKKEYTFESSNLDLKIIQISDLHIGSGLIKPVFKKNLEKINNEHPDVIMITGDLVDESTKPSDFLQAIELLKNLQARIGKYYILGNHDWNTDFFKNKMKETGFILLEDKQVHFDTFSIIGRKDAFQTRKSLNEYTYIPHTYTIVCDHQPVDLFNNSQCPISLELCGHTHNGQIWPLGILANWFHENELVYGHKQIQSLHIVVTSGFGGWGYSIRTQGQSEYVVIHIQKKDSK